MQLADFDYDLPQELIAQHPAEPRDAARLLVLDRQSGQLEHTTFNQIGRYLRSGDLLVVNQTRVIPARLYGRKLPGGGRVEILLLRQEDELTWEALVGGQGLHPGRQLQLEDGPRLEIVADLGGSQRRVRSAEPLNGYLAASGHTPLPPYITAPLANAERYQTVYSRIPGSAAAPTAGLHFTPALLHSLQENGIGLATVTLHIGLDTFAPVREDDPRQHHIHREWCEMPAETVAAINQTSANGGRVVAVGTTSVRTIETAARAAGTSQRVAAWRGETDLYILPGFTFHGVDVMVTNFHLPRSTLLMLVSAFAGREKMLQTYETAKQQGYRFFSFGDAMLIL